MIIPTLPVEVFKTVGSDVYGQLKWARPVREKVCPVKLEFQSRPTSVRTDVAASKSRAAERNAQVVILAEPHTRMAINDKLAILGNSLRIIDMHPRYTVTGKLDHYQVDCEAWT